MAATFADPWHEASLSAVVVPLALALLVLASGCRRLPEPSPFPQPAVAAAAQEDTKADSPTAEPDNPPPSQPPAGRKVRFAAIGDYGAAVRTVEEVAALVAGWDPDFVITLGDNNYPQGAAGTIDQNVGRHYQAFISPYAGRYGDAAAENRFFPTLGNHDWDTAGAGPYLAYFTLPGNERYYAIARGPVDLFALSSDLREPDGIGSTSVQGQWLRQELESSAACWKLVYMHHPPFSSGRHGGIPWMAWPYAAWGADAVLAGHDHVYERIMRDGIIYFVNGLGGQSIYNFRSPVDGSAARYNGDFGAMLVEAQDGAITFRFFTRSGALVDEYTLRKPCP